jgi:hypothetical protein
LPSEDGESGPVLAKGGPKGPQLREVNVAIPSLIERMPQDVPNALIGDGLQMTDGVYEGGKCGVVALAGSGFNFFPFYGGMNKKELRDFEQAGECGWNWDGTDSTAVRRWVRVDLANAKVHTDVTHSNEPTFAQFIIDQSLPDIGTNDIMNHAKVAFFDVSGLSRGMFGVPYCNYLRFDNDVGSKNLRITHDGDGSTVHVETQPDPDNIGLCAYDVTLEPPLGTVLLHIDIAYDVKEKGQ